MKTKAVSRIMLTLLLVNMLTLAFSIQSLEANPVYPGQVSMTKEDIHVMISHNGSAVLAKVDGTYTFITFGDPGYILMYYPVPPDAYNISVKIDETILEWNWKGGTPYPTIIGDYPFIAWWIYPVPADFLIRTHYEHTVPLIEGKYQFLYAMGTGRYLAEPKFCEVTVETYISKDVALTQSCIEVYLVTEEGILEPATYVIDSLDEMWNVTYYIPDWFANKDFLVMITPNPCDVDGDGDVDVSDLFDLSKAYGCKLGDDNWNPNCDFNDDEKIDDSDLSDLNKNYGKTV